MSWFPNFLTPLTGAIAAAIAIPALLVLYLLKLRRRELEVSSTLLWKKAIQDLQVNAPFQKLRRNLLLILQLMILVALCLALTRPVTFFKPGAGKATVILIDHSASMNAMDIDGGKSSRLDEAKRQAKELVSTMQRGSSALVIAFADESGTKTVQSFTTDTNALKRAIDSIEPTDRRTQLKLAYQLADANMGYNPDQLRENTEPPNVEVFSDGRVLDGSELSIKGTPKFNQIGTDQAGNIAVVALSAKRNYDRPTEVQIFARLVNFGPKPISADVELGVAELDPSSPANPNFNTRGVAVVNLPPARWSDEAWAAKNKAEIDAKFPAKDSVEFTLELTTAATIKIEHKTKDGDVLAADDAAYVSVPPPKALSVLLVTEGNPFMERLLNSLNLRDPQVLSPTEYEEKLPTSFDLIIFDRAYTPTKLPPAGNFIYFGSIAPGLKLAPETDSGRTVLMDNVGVLDWRRDHPILKGLSLGKVYALEAIKLKIPPESEVLIEGTKGPLMVLHREGRSTHLVVAFNAFESHWPVTISFPIFMYQAVQFMAAGTDLNVSQSYQPGATPRIPRTNLAQAEGGPTMKRVRLNGPGISRDQTVPEAGDFTLQSLDRVGVYRTDPPIPQFERMAVNLLDENESNLIPADKAPGGIGEAVAADEAKRARLDLWWWIVACGAIPLLLIEWWVYTRRVHL